MTGNGSRTFVSKTYEWAMSTALRFFVARSAVAAKPLSITPNMSDLPGNYNVSYKDLCTDQLIKRIRETEKHSGKLGADMALAYMQAELQTRHDYNPNAIRIQYSRNQWDALVDSCLYGMSYGMEIGEDEYIEAEMLRLYRLKKGEYKYVRMDDHNCEHVCERITGIR